MNNFSSIKNWALSDRPREKYLKNGKNHLSDAELIAILIGSGHKDSSAVELSKEILSTVSNNLIELSKLDIDQLQKFKGIGEAKAISIAAAMELGRRRRSAEVIDKKKISCSRDAFEVMQEILSDNYYESFAILCLNRANKIINRKIISEGGFAGTVADPKKIFRIALEKTASSIILAHNHPSGNIQPSEADIKLTKKLVEAGKHLDLPVFDHIITGDDSYYSFADEGVL